MPTGLFLGHAFLGAQLAEPGNHRHEYRLVVFGLEFGLFQGFQSQLLAAGENGFPFADDDHIDDVTLQQIIGGHDDTVFRAFRKNNGFLVGLGLAQQTVLERIRRGRNLGRCFDGRDQIGGVDIVPESGVGLGDRVVF